MSKEERVSVVIPARKSDCIAATLEALKGQSSHSFEVVVVENGEKKLGFEGTVEGYGHSIDCRYHYLNEIGANRARNYGVAQTKFPIVAFTDDDCIPSVAWIETIIEEYKNWPHAEIIGGRTVLDFETPPPPWLVGPFRDWLSEVDWGNEARPLTGKEYLVSANMTIRRSTLERLGGLHTHIAEEAARNSFMPQNDELGIQNHIKSTSTDHVVYTPTLVVRHQITASRLNLEWMLKRNYGQGRSDILLAAQNNNLSASDLNEILLRTMQPEDWLGYMKLPYARSLVFDRETYERNFVRCKLAYWQGAVDQISELS